jgi:hypothetical protein
MGHIVHSSASGAQNGDTLFFMLGRDKKHDGTHYVKLVILHLMGSADHVVHSGAFRAQKAR